MAPSPLTRVLAVLELLQSHGRITGRELSARLDVDIRTVRRYIAVLEEIGIPITAERGPEGGYELIAGYKIPPLMFSYAEAVAISLGLAAVRGMSLTGDALAIDSAQVKLERVMPLNVRRRMRSLRDAVSFSQLHAAATADSAILATLSAAIQSEHGVRLHYRDLAGATTQRDFDPYGIAFVHGRWYTAGHCHTRNGLRTFRLDRITQVDAQSTRYFERPTGFDAVSHVEHSLAMLPRLHTVEVTLHTTFETARAAIAPAIGTLNTLSPQQVQLQTQVDDLDWMARELARLPFPFDIVAPPDLKTALHDLAQRLLRL
ncbi:transcriptional regulator [Bryobacterales bacterium F-183]|nr:transcriptional regulator [Bryobacterales bacterium F-183]